MVSNFHPISSLGLALVAASLLLSCGGRDPDGTWEMPNGDLASTRAAAGPGIDTSNVSELEVRWRYTFTAKPTSSGVFASTPVADRATVYVQDLQSNVHALDAATGAVRWKFDTIREPWRHPLEALSLIHI